MNEHNPSVDIAVLGPLLVRVGGAEQPIAAAKQRLLLARLVIDAGHVVSPDQLIDALWGETPPETAAKNLRVLVGRLRAIVGAGSLVTAPGGYRLDPDACTIDAVEFEQIVSHADRLASAPDHQSEALSLLADALTHWRGAPAGELDTAWGAPLVARWTELRRVAQERLLALRVADSPTPELIDEIRAHVEGDPLRESLRVLLVDALRRAGDLPSARIALDDALASIGSELGLVPGRALAERAAEFGIDSDVRPAAAAGAPATVLAAIAALGARFRVADVLAAVMSGTSTVIVAEADVLDALEAMLDRGELHREVDDGGRVLLTRTTAAAGDEVAS